jgi:hypothetical protein
MENFSFVSDRENKETGKTDSRRVKVIYPEGTGEARSTSMPAREENIWRSWLEKCLAALAAAIGFTFLLLLCYLWLHVF